MALFRILTYSAFFQQSIPIRPLLSAFFKYHSYNNRKEISYYYFNV